MKMSSTGVLKVNDPVIYLILIGSGYKRNRIEEKPFFESHLYDKELFNIIYMSFFKGEVGDITQFYAECVASDSYHKVTSCGYSLLHMSLLQGSYSLFDYIMKNRYKTNIDFDTRTEDGRHPIELLGYGMMDIMMHVTTFDPFFNNGNVFRSLISEKLPMNPHMKPLGNYDYEKLEPMLRQAIEADRVDLLKFLLKYEPDLNQTTIEPLLHIAAARGNIDIIKALLNAGANPRMKYIGEVASKIARRYYHYEAERVLRESFY